MGSTSARARAPCQSSPPEVVKLNQAVSRAARRGYGGVLLQAAAAVDGQVFFAGAAGHLMGRQTSQISTGDSFEVASITKMVTATVVMQLVDEGQVRLDEVWSSVADVEAKVKEHVPTWPSERFGDFTVAQLLQHTSGLPNYWDGDGSNNEFIKAFEADPDRLWTTWELLSYAANMKTSCSPQQRGTAEAFAYADTNYLLLGLMIEALDQQTLPAIFRRRVFDPAGMSRQETYCEFLEERPAGAPPLASRYLGKLQITGKKQHSADSFAAGGIVSTTRDLEKFMAALASGKLFPINGQATLQKMMCWIPAKRGPGWFYGLGLMRIDLKDQVGLLSRLRGITAAGYVWGHEGFGGAFAWYWSNDQRDIIITGTTNDEDEAYGDLVMAAVQQVPKLLQTPVIITS